MHRNFPDFRAFQQLLAERKGPASALFAKGLPRLTTPTPSIENKRAFPEKANLYGNVQALARQRAQQLVRLSPYQASPERILILQDELAAELMLELEAMLEVSP